MVVPASGTGLRRTSLGGCPEPAAVRWSADGRSVLVAPSFRQPMFLCRFDPATHTFSSRQDLAAALGNPGAHYQVRIDDFDWSRDGTRLALANQQRLVVLDLKTGRKRLIYRTPSPDRTVDAVAWSPDGRRVAFSMPGKDLLGDGGEVYEDLWLINADGSGLRRLGHGAGPSWSPDGTRLVAVEGGDSGGPAVVSYQATSGVRRVLRKIEMDYFAAVTYSPDGRYIAAVGPQTFRGGAEGTSLFLMDGQGRVVRTLVAGPQLGNISYPLWLTW